MLALAVSFQLSVAVSFQLAAQNKPIIGISCNATGSAAHIAYVEAVEKAGGIPLIVPRIDEKSDLSKVVEHLDGLLLIGGEDVDPVLYGEQAIPEMGEVVPWRDDYDISLVRLADKAGIPVLGICRGIQVINVAYGGTLYQDLPAQYLGLTESHSQKEPATTGTHLIIINEGSNLAGILTGGKYMVNSFHHQAVKDPAPGFSVDAWSPEGVIEAISHTGASGKTIRGVQFHPERMAGESDALLPIFTSFIREAATTQP